MKISIRTGLPIMAVCMALGACAGVTDPTVGNGSITLSKETEKAFTDYQAKVTPRYFAVSNDGQSFYYSFCDGGRCIRQAKTQVIDRCESYSNGVPCKIYASRGVIVWTEDS